MKKKKIIFVVDKIGVLEICSIPLLSALAKKEGCLVELIDFSANPGKASNAVISSAPDIVCYSICSSEAGRYLEINRILKSKADFFSLFGGPHPTFFPDFIEEDGVDAICRGEGDISFPLFLKYFGGDEVYNTPNFYFKTDNKIIKNELTVLVQDLDGLPFPDRDIVYSKSHFMARNPVKTFFAGRGCPFDCSYCFNHSFNEMYKGKGSILRVKSVGYLFTEIRAVRERYPLTFIKFHDDIFGADKGWLAEFAQRYPREIGLPFLNYARPNMVSEDYAASLKKAGCFSVCLAVESGNEKTRNRILNRGLTNEQIESACAILNRCGLRIYSLNMIGLPGESEKEISETIEFNRRIKAAFTDASILQPYPGTQINKYCRENGYLGDDTKVFNGQFSTSVLNFEADFKERIYILQKLFSILVAHPSLSPGLRFLYRFKSSRLFKKIIDLIHRCYYAGNLHRNIYASKIPLALRLRGSILLLASKNRV